MVDESLSPSPDMLCLRATTLQKTVVHMCGYFRSLKKTKEGGKKSRGNSCAGFRNLHPCSPVPMQIENSLNSLNLH